MSEEKTVENEEEIDFETVKSAVLTLLKVTNPEEALAIIQQHPVLLTAQADHLFEVLINNAQAEEKNTFVVILTGLRNLVQNYRQLTTTELAKTWDEKEKNVTDAKDNTI